MTRANDAFLTNEFNRRLASRERPGTGFYGGKPTKPHKYWPTKETIRSGRSGSRTRIETGGVTLKPAAKATYQRQFGPISGSSSAVSSFHATISNMYSEAEKQLIERQNTEKAIETVLKAGVPKKDSGGGGSWFDKVRSAVGGAAEVVSEHVPKIPGPVGEFIGPTGAFSPIGMGLKAASALKPTETDTSGQQTGGVTGLMEGFGNSPAGRALDVISRPYYGLTAFAKGTLEADYGGEDFWQSLGHGLREGASGVAGTEKKGWGDVFHTWSEGSKMGLAQDFRNLEKSHPEVAKWTGRGVGLAGDITIDPLKPFHLSTAPLLRTGEALTESTAKSAVRSIAETAAKNALENIKQSRPGAKWRPSEWAMRRRAINNADAVVEQSLLEVSGGARKGFAKLGNESFAQATAAKVADGVKKSLFEPFEKRVKDLVEPLQNGNLPNATQLRSHIARNPEFAELIDNVEKGLAGQGRSYANVNELLRDLRPGDLKLIENEAQGIRNGFEHVVSDVANEVYAASKDIAYNTVGIRMPTGHVIPMKTVGKVWKATKEVAGRKAAANFEEAASHLSYEHNFPGKMSLITQKARSLGLKGFEDYRDVLQKFAKDYSPAEAKEIHYALDEGRTLTGKLEQGRQFVEDAYKQIMMEEVASGVRPENAKWMDDYAFIWNKGGSAKARKAFKEGRAEQMALTGTKGRWNMATAAHDGLKPVDNAFEALLLRKMKSSRDLTRSYFLKDMVDNYGTMSKKLTGQYLREAKMSHVGVDKLDHNWRALLAKHGEELYIPQAHKDMIDTFNKLSSFSPKDSGYLLRNYAKFTDMMKWGSTVPRPGFHIRNMIGDYFMGLLDNVPSKAYGEVATKWEAWKRLGQMPGFRITKGITKSIEELWTDFQKYANTGFFETELQQAGVSTGLKGAAGKVAEGLRTASENRENYGRFVHFISAYRQEAQGLVAKGMKEGPRLEQKALEAAVWRVNHYKFDYNALTAFERKVKLAFPFYTFARKATPTLMESLLLSPHYMGVSNRFMTMNDGSSADAFNSYFLPKYVKDTGYAMLGQDSPEPYFMRGDISPTNVLNNLDFTNFQEFAKSIAQQTNPIAQVIPELATGKQFFSDRPTGDLATYLSNKLPIGANVVRETTGNDKPGWLARVSNTFTGMGLPIEKFSDARQQQGFREAEDRVIQGPMYDFNRRNTGLRVYQSNRSDGSFSYRVANATTGDIYFEANNPTTAILKARALAAKMPKSAKTKLQHTPKQSAMPMPTP